MGELVKNSRLSLSVLFIRMLSSSISVPRSSESYILMKRFVKYSLAILLTAAGCTFALNGSDERPDRVSMAVVGDVMCHAPQLSAAWNAQTKRYEFAHTFEPVAPYLSRADLAIANLETTLPGDRKKYSGYPTFGAPDSLAVALKDAGIDVLTLANNHTLDKGKSGMLRTIEVVERLGFAHLGSYRSVQDKEDRRVLVVEKNGLRLAFLNFTYGTNGIKVPRGTVVNLIDEQRIVYDLAAARRTNADAIIVIYHYGGEYLRQPDAYQKKWTDFAIEHGADIVIGGHPHVLQPFGVRTNVTDKFGRTADRLIAFSLGNFVSNQQRRYTDGGKIFQFTIERNPDEQSDQKVVFRDISYEPVWVYVERGQAGRKYFVLPVNEYLQNNAGMPLQLPASARAKMVRFYTDTTEHLKGSVDSVAEFRSGGE